MTENAHTPWYLPEKTYLDDVFLVSYPKSGSTWLRFLIGNYLTDNKCDFTNCHLNIPDIHLNPEQCEKIPRPRFIKSHIPFVPEYKKVVYLVRDGRDVAVSYYFHSIKHGHIEKGVPFRDFLRQFNKGAIGGFGLWSDHVNSWLYNSPHDFLLIRYEDMKQDVFRELERVLNFADLSTNRDAMLAAIEASSLRRMKALEKAQHHQFEGLANSDPSIPFVRKGQAGDYTHFFTEELTEEFMAVHGTALKRLNYLSESSNAVLPPSYTDKQHELNGTGQISLQTHPILSHKSAPMAEQAAGQPAHNTEALLSRAIERLNARDHEAALRLFERAIHIQPDMPGLNYGKALALARLGHTPKAIETLNCLITTMPEHRKAKRLLEELHASTEGKARSRPDNLRTRTLQPPTSPLTGSANVVLEKEISCHFIIESYKQSVGIDVEKYFEGLDAVQIYKCRDTGYRFYYPPNIQGDAQLYKELQKFPWYYIDWKWEHQIASSLIKPTHKVLEIGCGRGGFLENLQQRGVTGVGLELSADAVEAARRKGLNVRKQSVEEHVRSHPGEYDVVCLFQVLEHIVAVREFMQAAIEALKPNGTLIISVPNNDSFLFQWDEAQPLNRPPHHVGLWDMTSLINLAKVFGLTLGGIEIEPVQPYHMDWAQSLLKEKFTQQYGPIEKAAINNNASMLLKVTQLFLPHVSGHTSLAHYTRL